jgi:hypothetical protein
LILKRVRLYFGRVFDKLIGSPWLSPSVIPAWDARSQAFFSRDSKWTYVLQQRKQFQFCSCLSSFAQVPSTSNQGYQICTYWSNISKLEKYNKWQKHKIRQMTTKYRYNIFRFYKILEVWSENIPIWQTCF